MTFEEEPDFPLLPQYIDTFPFFLRNKNALAAIWMFSTVLESVIYPCNKQKRPCLPIKNLFAKSIKDKMIICFFFWLLRLMLSIYYYYFFFFGGKMNLLYMITKEKKMRHYNLLSTS